MDEYLESNDELPLLIVMKFKKKIDLKWLRIHAVNARRHSEFHIDLINNDNASFPNKIKIYKINNLDINHNNIQLIEPSVDVIFSKKFIDDVSGQKVNVEGTFKSTQCIAIYFENNQKNITKTFLNSITFYGVFSEVQDNQFATNDILTQVSETATIETDNINSQYLLDRLLVRDKWQSLRNCPGKHGLKTFITDNHICDLCKKDMLIKTAWGCRECDYDLCSDCCEEECVFSECSSSTRIIKALSAYNLSMTKSVGSQSIALDENNQHNTELLNHFNHLLLHHDDNDIFENIHNILLHEINNGLPCVLSNCIMMRRHYRDRSVSNRKLFKELYCSDDSNDIVTQQLLDRVHCHYFHTFDIGYRLKQKEKEHITNDDVKISKENENSAFDSTVFKIGRIIENKRNKHRNIQSLERLNNKNNKFTTGIMKSSSTDNRYSFGYRYFYWNYYKDNDDPYDDAHHSSGIVFEERAKANDGTQVKSWYISKKYKNLKEELLTNAICTLATKEVDIVILKAAIHLRTDHCKRMKCERIKSTECYEIKQDAPIASNHLVAMTVYCSFDDLQYKFSETFRRLYDGETDKSLKHRHQNYYHLGKLLRELVECYGSSFTNYKDSINLYHGINRPFTFSSMSAFIKGPLSTTTDYMVAANFCDSQGLIITFQVTPMSFKINLSVDLTQIDGKPKAICTCFDCNWISDYSNEQEIFFVGGLYKLEFKSIIDATISANFELYIRGLVQLDDCASMDGSAAFTKFDGIVTKQDKQMLLRLLSHEIYRYFPNHKHAHQFKSCPEYFEEIFHLHCMNIKRIVFSNDSIVNMDSIDLSPKKYIFEEIFRGECGWLDLHLILTVFPFVQGIQFVATEKKYIEIMKCSIIYQSVLNLLKRKLKKMRLEMIVIVIKPMFASEMSDHVQKYKIDFVKHGWDIIVIYERKYDSFAHICIARTTALSKKRPKILASGHPFEYDKKKK
eukprot:184352_1